MSVRTKLNNIGMFSKSYQCLCNSFLINMINIYGLLHEGRDMISVLSIEEGRYCKLSRVSVGKQETKY